MSSPSLPRRSAKRLSIYDVLVNTLMGQMPPDFYGPADLPDCPTDHAPGTDAKINVMRHRALLRQQLHHPDDYGARVSPDVLAALQDDRPSAA